MCEAPHRGDKCGVERLLLLMLMPGFGLMCRVEKQCITKSPCLSPKTTRVRILPANFLLKYLSCNASPPPKGQILQGPCCSLNGSFFVCSSEQGRDCLFTSAGKCRQAAASPYTYTHAARVLRTETANKTQESSLLVRQTQDDTVAF